MQNRLNQLFVSGIDKDGNPSAPRTVNILQDSQPPNLFIDFPTNGQVLASSDTVIAGRVGDMLSGFMGLDVVVSNYMAGTTSTPPSTFSAPANVNVGIGNHGTYELSRVPLALGSNVITVAATDKFGNLATNQITIYYSLITNAARLEVVSGDMQMTNVHRPLIDPIVVQVLQADGSPFASKLVNFDVTRNDGRLLPVDTNQWANPVPQV